MSIIHADHPLDACGSPAKASLLSCFDRCISKVNEKTSAHVAIAQTVPRLPKEPPKEMRLKEWAVNESTRTGWDVATIRRWAQAGEIFGLQIREVNKRVKFVLLESYQNTIPMKNPKNPRNKRSKDV